MEWVCARMAFAILRETKPLFCVGPRSNGNVDVAWMMLQASPLFLTTVNII